MQLRNVGPLRQADISFGDLTVLVGPQATGKSIFLQLLKLMVDAAPVKQTLRRYGFDWNQSRKDFFDLYFGEGMEGIWHRDRSSLRWQGKDIDIQQHILPGRGRAEEKCFFIPAQRVLALSRDGWLRPFTDYKAGDPYTVRDFSETLRRFVDAGLGRDGAIFPEEGRLKAEIRRKLEESVFSRFRLRTERQGPQKRLVLTESGTGPSLPFMVWSAGQREYVPLLLGLYWVMPSTNARTRQNLKWVVIEELEMGLHPQAISATLLVVLDLLWRGYRVCLSTHSPHVLDLVWALRMFREHNAGPGEVLDLFAAAHTQSMMDVARKALDKQISVYYFDRKDGTAHDISALDPASDISREADWGGLTEFSGRVSAEVARVVARSR